MRQWKGWKKHFCPLVVGYFEHAFVILNKQSYAKTWKDLLLWSRHAYKIWYGKYQQTQPHPQGSQKLKSNRSWDKLITDKIGWLKLTLTYFCGVIISLSFHSFSTASETGHQAEADSSVRPGEECGPASHWAVDGGQPLQRHRGGLEPWNTGHHPSLHISTKPLDLPPNRSLSGYMK